MQCPTSLCSIPWPFWPTKVSPHLTSVPHFLTALGSDTALPFVTFFPPKAEHVLQPFVAVSLCWLQTMALYTKVHRNPGLLYSLSCFPLLGSTTWPTEESRDDFPLQDYYCFLETLWEGGNIPGLLWNIGSNTCCRIKSSFPLFIGKIVAYDGWVSFHINKTAGVYSFC